MRRSSVLTIAAVSCLLCGASAVRLNLHRSFALAAQEQSSEQSSSAQAAGQAAGLSRPQAAATVQPA
ncbi:MAG: hypothetical protein WBD59_14060, partial [Candidatus Sulfotelmatobacter sp.]